MGIGKLRPDVLPVVGAEVLAGDFAPGGALNGDTVCWGWNAPCVPMLPLPDLGGVFHADAIVSRTVIIGCPPSFPRVGIFAKVIKACRAIG